MCVCVSLLIICCLPFVQFSLSSVLKQIFTWDKRFSRQWRYKSRCSGLWYCVVLQYGTAVLEDLAAWRWRILKFQRTSLPSSSVSHCNTMSRHDLEDLDLRIYLPCQLFLPTSRVSLVSIETGYRLDNQTISVWFLRGAGNFSLQHHVQTGSGAHPASYPVGTGGSFPGGKATGAWSWPLTSILCQGQRMHGAIPPPSQYVFLVWCLVKHRDFTFNMTLCIYVYT
jgi:hypothetical protein